MEGRREKGEREDKKEKEGGREGRKGERRKEERDREREKERREKRREEKEKEERKNVTSASPFGNETSPNLTQSRNTSGTQSCLFKVFLTLTAFFLSGNSLSM